MAPYRIGKGGGSAHGGEWKPSPNKPQDQRFLGEPGQTNQSGNKKTHIGNDGKADYERHKQIMVTLRHTQIHMTTKSIGVMDSRI